MGAFFIERSAFCANLSTFLDLCTMIIAIDGPAGAGKGTLGHLLAQHYGFAFMDTGLLYRAVAHDVLVKGIDSTDENQVVAIVNAMAFENLDANRLRTNEVGEMASRIAALPKLRQELVHFQRDYAEIQNKQTGGAILDGRDIGTNILPDADLKFYITATLEARARRRHQELLERGESKPYEVVHEEVRVRDERDMNRSENPLRPAEDAIILETSTLSIEQGFAILKHFIESKTAL